ncbi:MAG: tetratricopeptide repeat protein [Bacteroidota bacterium]
MTSNLLPYFLWVQHIKTRILSQINIQWILKGRVPVSLHRLLIMLSLFMGLSTEAQEATWCLGNMIFKSEATAYSQDERMTIYDQLKQYKTDQEKLVFLDSITKKMVRTNDERKMKYIKQTVNLARQLGDYDMVARKSRFVLSDMSRRGLLDSAMIKVNALIKEKEKYKDPTSLAHLYLKRGGLLFSQTKHNEAIEDYNRAAVIFEANNKPLFAADGYHFAGSCYMNTHNYATAIAQLKKALRLYELGGDVDYVQHVTHTLIVLYDRIGLYDKALDERKLFLKKNKGKLTPYASSLCYMYMAQNYSKKKLFDEQKIYLDSAYSELQEIDDFDVQNSVPVLAFYICLGHVVYYLSIDHLENAEVYLKKAENYWQKTGAKERFETALFFHQAQVLEHKGETVPAGNLYKKILDKGFEIEDIWHRVNALEGLAGVLDKEGDYKNANKWRKAQLKLKDSLDEVQKENTLLLLQTEFETERHQKELAQRTAEVKNLELEQTVARNKRLVLLIILSLVVVVATTMTYFIWQRAKRKQQRLAEQIAANERDLTNYTQQLLAKSQEQEALMRELESLRSDMGAQSAIPILQELASSKILTSEDWRNFKHKFSLVYSDFFKNITAKGLQPTTSEERLLSLEKLELDSKEIANMLGISFESVMQSRYRLRKKWDVPKDTSILEFIDAEGFMS